MALIDDVRITVSGGDGGRGSSAHSGPFPNGGHGGDGGNVYAVASANISDLSEFRFVKAVSAASGENGLHKKRHGKNGEDKTVLFPPGTKIINDTTGEEIEVADTTAAPVLIARGGRGGRGNIAFKTSVKFPSEIDFTNEAEPGERKDLHLILSLIADAGLIGFPNAGKSSLLAKLTRATPKIGNYPFTTLEPSLGIMSDSKSKIVLADIPGLIEGASQGKGLGITFLKHIEKTKVLLHCITAEDPDPEKSYKLVHKEFEEFNVTLNDKKEIILLTKKDLVSQNVINEKINILSKLNKIVIPVSIYDEGSIKKLVEVIKKNTK